MGKSAVEENTELKKHVGAIHASNPLTLLQRKISNALLYHAYPELAQKEEHEITIKQLCNIIGYSGNNHAVIKEALKALISCVIEWNVLDEKTGEEDWTASAIIASANIKGSRCSYAYSPRMRKLLFSPIMYGKINLIVQSKFRSSYGLALYENCVRYKGLPYTKWFELELFRKLMGVPKDKYVIFRDFKKRVLDKAVEEINSFSDMIVEVEINRQGHKVIELRFKIKIREKKKWLGGQVYGNERTENLKIEDTPLIVKLKEEYNFTPNQISSLYEQYKEDFILEKIKIVESSASYKAGKIDKLSAYLIKALQDNYQQSKSSQEVKKKVQEQMSQALQKQEALVEKEENLKKSYKNYVNEYLEQVILKLSTKQRELIEEKFKEQLENEKNKLVLGKFLKEKLNNKIVRAHFRDYMKREYPILLHDIKTFEEYELQE